MPSTSQVIAIGVIVAAVAVGSYFLIQSFNGGSADKQAAAPVDMARKAAPAAAGADDFASKIRAEHKAAKKAGYEHPRAQMFAELRMAHTIDSGAGHQLQGPKVAASAVRTEEARHLPLFRINARYSESKNSLFLQLNGRKKPTYKLGKPITLAPNEDQISSTSTVTTLERKDS